MYNFSNKNTKRILVCVVAILIVVSMIVPTILAAVLA